MSGAGTGRTARVAAAAREALLWALAVLGVVCLVLAVTGFLGGWRIIMFRTGSMSPTIPTGSAALVHRIDATDARVGDVVTVERPGELPVTHRVVKATATEDGRGAVLTLRGDANPTNDPAPYQREHVSRVVASVPGAAHAIVALSRPWVMGAVTLVVAAWVTWAFWPRERRRGRHAAVPVE